MTITVLSIIIAVLGVAMMVVLVLGIVYTIGEVRMVLDKKSLNVIEYTRKGTVARRNHVAARSVCVGRIWTHYPEEYNTILLTDSGEEYVVNNEGVYHTVRPGDEIMVTITRWLKPDGTTNYEHHKILQRTECPI